MRAIDVLTPKIYSIVKRNPKLRKLLHPTWHFLAAAAQRVRTLFARRVEPPTDHYASVANWLAAAGASDETQAFHREIYPPHRVIRLKPVTIDANVHHAFSTHYERELSAAFVVAIPEGRGWFGGHGEAAITRDNRLLKELCKARNEWVEEYIKEISDHPIFRERRLTAPTRVKGTAAVLSSPGGGGYYHWMLDLLPRIHLLMKAGISLSSVDRFIVNVYVTDYQRETLDHFGIPRSKLIESHWHQHIQAETLLFPSLPGDFGHLPRWACDFLRSEFLNGIETGTHPNGSSHIYINRSGVAHRRVTNEDEVVELLTQNGFQDVSLESMPILDQIRMMSSAEVVCSPHGAGLTNLVFCQPGTKVIEFLSPNDVSHVYWTLASQMELKYFYLIGELMPESETSRFEEDIRINVGSLSKILHDCLST